MVLTHVVELDASDHCILLSYGDFLIAAITSSTGMLVSEPPALRVKSFAYLFVATFE